MSYVQAIRKRCMDCRGFHFKEVRDCDPTFEDGSQCPLYPYRFGKTPNDKPDVSPLKSIRAFCLHCCCGSSYEVTLCPAEGCPLWEYREGHNPKRKGVGRDSEHMAKIRELAQGEGNVE